jgi:hypothetical protein
MKEFYIFDSGWETQIDNFFYPLREKAIILSLSWSTNKIIA